MIEEILWLILFGNVVTVVLAIFLLNRVARSFRGAGKDVSDELRTSREEARNASRSCGKKCQPA